MSMRRRAGVLWHDPPVQSGTPGEAARRTFQANISSGNRMILVPGLALGLSGASPHQCFRRPIAFLVVTETSLFQLEKSENAR
jgi:hypothetical protein